MTTVPRQGPAAAHEVANEAPDDQSAESQSPESGPEKSSEKASEKDVENVVMEVTEDGFLDNALTIRQPRIGYRAAIDPLFLAAAVPAESGGRALDIGAGVGVAALALAHRVAGLGVTGIEIDPAMMRLAADNAQLNGLEDRADFMVGNLARPPARLVPGSFDHVMANPPYLEVSRANASPVAGRAAANLEGRAGAAGNEADLDAWLRFAFAMVRDGGSVTVIHRADRLDDVVSGFKRRAGGIIIYPLWPDRDEAPAKRVLIQGRKGSHAPARMARGLVLHEDGGGFTADADLVLRYGCGLIL
jgi:tRNA1(Val) A37 N6-methylase TrmN6